MPSANRVATYGPTVGTHEQELKGSDVNTLQDKTNILVRATEEEGSLPTADAVGSYAFKGGNWMYGQFTINALNDKELDDSRDWRNVIGLMFVVQVVVANNELPDGVNHDPDNGAWVKAWQLWGTDEGEAAGGGFGAGDFAWNPMADLWIYVNSTDGHLWARNDHAANNYDFYMMCMLSGSVK